MWFGPWRCRLPVQEVGGASGLGAQVRTHHTHLCNVVILIRPFQEGVREPQARYALKHNDGTGSSQIIITPHLNVS